MFWCSHDLVLLLLLVYLSKITELVDDHLNLGIFLVSRWLVRQPNEIRKNLSEFSWIIFMKTAAKAAYLTNLSDCGGKRYPSDLFSFHEDSFNYNYHFHNFLNKIFA